MFEAKSKAGPTRGQGQGQTTSRPKPGLLEVKSRARGLSNPIHSPVRNSKLRTTVKQQRLAEFDFGFLFKIG